MRAQIEQGPNGTEVVTLRMARQDANSIFYALTELGARTDEQEMVREIWAFFDQLHQIPVEGSLVTDLPKKSRKR